MKRSVFIFLSLFLLAGCREDVPVIYNEQAVISYDIEAPVEFEVKSTSSAGAVNTLWYGVYHKKADGSYVYMEDMSSFVTITDPSSIQVPVSLIKDQEYRIVFVAQHRSSEANSYTYTIDGEGIMKYNTSAANAHSSAEELDAFIFVDETGVMDGDLKKNIELERPLSRISLYTSSSSLPEKTTVKVSGVPASYDLFADKASEETMELTFGPFAPDESTVVSGGQTCDNVVSFYVFGGNEVKCDFTFTYADNATKTLTVEKVSTAPNHKTNIVGNI